MDLNIGLSIAAIGAIAALSVFWNIPYESDNQHPVSRDYEMRLRCKCTRCPLIGNDGTCAIPSKVEIAESGLCSMFEKFINKI